MNLYTDYTEAIDLERQVGQYIGGGNYAREVIRLILKQRNPETDVKVLVITGQTDD